MIDLRFDPFLFEFRPKNLTGEIKTVQHFPAFNRVGFFLNESPQRLTSRPVSIICAGDTLSEVGRLTAPGADNFRIDYGNVANFAQTGFVELNAARVGQVAVINYRGLGVNLNASLRDDAMPNLQRSVIANQNATVRGLAVTGSLDFNTILSAGMQRIRELTTVSASDIINLATFMGMTSRSAPQMLTGSGFWEKPANVQKVFFVLIGPGGSGHIDGGGGGGGASVYGVADLDVIGGNMFAYVCGVVGIATTMFGCVAGAGGSGASGGAAGAGGAGSVGVDVIGSPAGGGNGVPAYFVAISQDGTNRIMASIDGVTWNARSAGENNQWNGLISGNGVFVAVASDGVNRVTRSTDGITWTAHAASSAASWFDVAYGSGLYVAIANGSAVVMTSPDGETWTGRAVPEANSWVSIIYGNGLFVAVAQSGANRVMTSPDGITWTARSIPAGTWNSVVWSGSKFVAVSSGSGDYVATSPDGITWTAQTAAANNAWYGVTFGNGVFVAVSQDGTDRVMTSTDGVTWVSRSAAAANTWLDVTFGNGVFVAVSQDGTDRVMTSTDGVTWVSRSASENNTWRRVEGGGYGAGGGSGGGLGGNGNDADCGKPGARKGFFSGSGGDATNPPESFGGGAGAGGTGADGLILLVY